MTDADWTLLLQLLVPIFAAPVVILAWVALSGWHAERSLRRDYGDDKSKWPTLDDDDQDNQTHTPLLICDDCHTATDRWVICGAQRLCPYCHDDGLDWPAGESTCD